MSASCTYPVPAMLNPSRPNSLLLLSEPKVDRHDHLHGDRLVVQIRGFILPFLQRIECGLVQEGWSRDNFHLYDVPVFIQNCINSDLALSMGFPCEYRVLGRRHADCFWWSHVPANTALGRSV